MGGEGIGNRMEGPTGEGMTVLIGKIKRHPLVGMRVHVWYSFVKLSMDRGLEETGGLWMLVSSSRLDWE